MPAQTLHSAIEMIQTTFKLASAEEVFATLAIPVLATIVGHYFTRRIDAEPPGETLLSRLINFLSPLIVPAFALGFAAVAVNIFRAQGMESALLVFVLKLAAAWFAFRLIRRMIEKRIAGWFIALALIPITILQLFGLLDVTIEMLQSLKFSIGSLELNLYQVTKGIIALMALQWLASLTVHMVDSRLQNINDLRASNRALIVKIFSIFVYCFVFLFAMQLLGINLTALGVLGGALGVGVGFGLQKIASNFISGIILLFEKSIETGDLIELADGTTGFVRQTYARYTRLEMQTGKELLIPNEEFIIQRVVSWTHTNKKAQIEIPVHVPYDTDVRLAQELMKKAAEEHKSRLPNSDIDCFLSAFNESGVELRLQFWLRDVTRGRSQPRSEVMLAILESFKANNIVIAAPRRQVRVINETGIADAAVLGADGA